MKISRILTFLAIVIMIVSCVKDEFNFDDLSKEVRLEREIAMPLIKGELVFEDINNESWDSLIITGGDTIKLYLIDEIEQTDTLPLGELIENLDLEYINLHHSFTNMFPVGVDVHLYLHDSIAGQNIDTIYLSQNHNEILLPPAEVDEDGLVIEELVQLREGVVEFDDEALDNLMERTTHIVFIINVPPTSGLVKILDHYLLSLKLGIEGKGAYTTTLDSNN
jgi:hypothetical protein